MCVGITDLGAELVVDLELSDDHDHIACCDAFDPYKRSNCLPEIDFSSSASAIVAFSGTLVLEVRSIRKDRTASGIVTWKKGLAYNNKRVQS